MNEFANKLEDYRNQLSHLDNKIIDLLNTKINLKQFI